MKHRSLSRAAADNQAATTKFQSILTEKQLVPGSFLASAGSLRARCHDDYLRPATKKPS
jgi:hypothetical protein